MLGAIERLPEIQQRLKDVVIENRSYDAVIKAYNKEESLFYLDPPYYDAEDGSRTTIICACGSGSPR